MMKTSLWEWIRIHATVEDNFEGEFIQSFRLDDEMRHWMKYKDMKRNLKSRGLCVDSRHYDALKGLRKKWKKWTAQRKRDERNNNNDSGPSVTG